ncbi:MAG: hypothetical protein Q7S76_01665 [bacterium]|nr:hypothetical protein [bacterium]
MRKPILPHIFRDISAGRYFWPQTVLLWGLLTTMFWTNWTLSNGVQPRLRSDIVLVLSDPLSPSKHVMLASSYWKERLLNRSRQEIRLAEELTENIDTNSPLVTLGQWEDEVKNVQKEYEYWSKIVEINPDYRDGYLKLAGLAVELLKSNEAKRHIGKVYALDPNTEEIQKIENLLIQN